MVLIVFWRIVAIFLVVNCFELTNATCSQTQFDNCVSNLGVDYPCTPSEFDSYCSNYTVARQCLDSINCAVGDVGYTEVENFGNFSNYALTRNAIDSSLMLCANTSELTNQSYCVLWGVYPIDFKAVSWIGDYCGFLRAYYGSFGSCSVDTDSITHIVVDAILKRYELQQSKCPPHDWVPRCNWTKLDECFNETEAPPVGCSTAKLNYYCSKYSAQKKCCSTIGLATWDLGYMEFLARSRYVPTLYFYRDLFESFEYLCAHRSVINSTCILEDRLLSDFWNIFDKTEQNSTYEDLCSALVEAVDTLYANLTNKYGEEMSTILTTFIVKVMNRYGCYKDDATFKPPTAVINHGVVPAGVDVYFMPLMVVISTLSFVFAGCR